MPERLPTSRYFRLEVLAPGVFAAMVQNGTGAWANAGIIDLGDRTVIFDTFAVPAAAEELRRAALALTGRNQIDYVVNSHWHSDHVRGNLAFPDAAIVATPRTRALIIAETGTPEAERQGIAAGIRHRVERLAVEEDAAKRRGFLRLEVHHQWSEWLGTQRLPWSCSPWSHGLSGWSELPGPQVFAKSSAQWRSLCWPASRPDCLRGASLD